MKAIDKVNNIISNVFDFCGISLELADKKIYSMCGKKYFVINIQCRDTFNNPEINNIERLIGKFDIIDVQPNGFKRLAIFFI